MSWVRISRAEHRKITTSPAMQELVKKVAAKIAKEANAAAGIADGYVSESEITPNPDVAVDRRFAQSYVWAKTGEAIRAERRDAILMGIVASRGARR